MLVAAGVTAGRGLKRDRHGRSALYLEVAAGVTAGRGLKPTKGMMDGDVRQVAAGVTAGRGLKHLYDLKISPAGCEWRPA